MIRTVPALVAFALVAASGVAFAQPASHPMMPAHPAAAAHPPAPAPDDGLSNRMTASLNLLEADGYGDFSGFHKTEQDFAATVFQDGRSFEVAIDPVTGRITRRN